MELSEIEQEAEMTEVKLVEEKAPPRFSGGRSPSCSGVLAVGPLLARAAGCCGICGRRARRALLRVKTAIRSTV